MKSKKTCAILYICTGRYNIFWNDFYQSAEKYFLPDTQKHYLVFSNSFEFVEPTNDRIHLFFQEQLDWPMPTLLRFKMFSKVVDQLLDFDYVFFFNANMLFLDTVNLDILPSKEQGLLVVKHPGFYDKNRSEFTYESNPMSKAFISQDQGFHYFMGGFNGGISSNYCEMILTLSKNIEEDLGQEIIAIWHDESHLNHYMLDKNPKILSPAYGYPEGWDLPFERKVLIRDKSKLGGHDYLRNLANDKDRSSSLPLFKIRSYIAKISRHIYQFLRS
jgi:hypothetical protein